MCLLIILMTENFRVSMVAMQFGGIGCEGGDDGVCCVVYVIKLITARLK